MRFWRAEHCEGRSIAVNYYGNFLWGKQLDEEGERGSVSEEKFDKIGV